MSQISPKTAIAVIIYRIVFLILTQNYEYPDQHWQGPQVAHKLYYGFGYLTWQWTLNQPLRNPVYPFLLSLSYPIIQLLKLQNLTTYGPKIIQLFFAVITDLYLIKTTQFIFGKITKPMLIFLFLNWYYASTLVRTYANSFETCLTLTGFYYWITNTRHGNNNSKDLINRIIVSIGYISRPTSIIIWAILWPYQLFQISKIYGIFSRKSVLFVFKNILNIVIMFVLSLIIGSIYFNKVTSTQINFLKYNFVQKWSNLYGQQHLLFYIFVTIPFLMNIGLVFLFLSLVQLYKTKLIRQQFYSQKNRVSEFNKKNIKIIVLLVLIYMGISSLSTHKQHRFIFPILPFIMIISTYVLTIQQFKLFQLRLSYSHLKAILVLYVAFNIGIFCMFNVYGKGNSQTAWNYIKQQMEKRNMTDNKTSVIVFGQAHFMPGYYLLHRNISYRISDSSAIKMATNNSENKLLWQNPERLYDILTDGKKLRPDFIITQGKHLQHTAHILINQKYRQTRFWRHCTLPEEVFIEYDSINIFQPIF